VRGTGAAPVMAAAAPAGAPGATSVNNVIVGAFLVLGVLAALGYWFWYNRELKQRQEVVRQKTEEARKLEAIIKEVEDYQRRKDSLQKRIDLINNLKKNQKGPVRIMDQISRELPDLVWLDRMVINRGRVNINGRGLNPNAIALFIENIKKNPYFEEPAVGAVVQISSSPLVYTYDMSFGFRYTPTTETPQGAAGSTTTAGTTTAPTTTAAATGTP
ncbi:MAG TPA: PilN domain-containing protein, partial [Thermoanaerobaculia bacterium]|nr:PilN domain-containing protein [Thermoanaerobaculia bacterium]